MTPRADVGTLNSTIEALGRAGNSLQQFDSLEASIGKVADRIELKDGHTSGKSIGLTTAGIIDLEKEHATCAASSCRASPSTTCCRTCRCSGRC